MRKVLTILVMLIVAAAAVAYVGVESLSVKTDEIMIENIDLSTVQDGTYTGAFATDYVSAEAVVMVEGGEITFITLKDHKFLIGRSAEIVLGEIKAQQSLDVDTVSGATRSSMVILKAVENALKSGQE